MISASLQIAYSIMNALTSWLFIALLGRNLEAEQMSLFLVAWSFYGYVSLLIFSQQDSISNECAKVGDSTNATRIHSWRAKMNEINAIKISTVFLILTVSAIAIHGKVGLIILACISALSHFPTVKFVKDSNGPGGLNLFLLLNSIVRLLMVIVFLVLLKNDVTILYLTFSTIIGINILFLYSNSKPNWSISPSSLTINFHRGSKWLLLWGILYSDTIFFRLFLSSAEARDISILSLILKGFFIMQILPLSHVGLMVKQQNFQSQKLLRSIKLYFPFFVFWTLLAFFLLFFQTEFLMLMVPGAEPLKIGLLIVLVLYHSMFSAMFALLENIDNLGTKFIIMIACILISVMIFGNVKQLGVSYLILSLMAIQGLILFRAFHVIANSSK